MRTNIKTKHSAYGAQISCVNFKPCPLCYGCRNYNSKYIECNECLQENKTYNICNTKFHTAEKLALMMGFAKNIS